MAILDNDLFLMVDYGRIEFNIKNIMEKRNLSINQLVKKTGLHHNVIKRYYNGENQKYDGDVLAKLCYILNCDLSDIMYYVSPVTK